MNLLYKLEVLKENNNYNKKIYKNKNLKPLKYLLKNKMLQLNRFQNKLQKVKL